MGIAFFIALALLLISILLDKAARQLPLKELKRRARSGKDNRAAAIYKMAAFGRACHTLYWVVSVSSAAVILVDLARNSWWQAALALAAIAVLVLVWHPRGRGNGWLWATAAFLAPYIVSVLNLLKPALNILAAWSESLKPLKMHTGLYEREDLLDLLNAQKKQYDSRIPEEELKIVRGALTFGDKKVAEAMTPRRAVKFVAASDTVGPMLMDELHKSGLSRFPVVKELSKGEPQVIGTFYIKDVGLEDMAASGSRVNVRDLMQKNAYFINEDQTLRQALAAFLKTHHHLLVVVNNFEEVVGVLSLEDVLEQILGEPIIDEFDRYDDLRAMAGAEAEKEKTQHHEITEAEQAGETVVK